jgi:proteasome lid subunit RPN8/RPN11
MLHLPDPLRRQLAAHAASTYPHECCGLLLGTRLPGGQVSACDIFPAANTAEPAHHADRYELDPQAFLRADRRAREVGAEIIGFYHSHPDHPARPSATDLSLGWPGYLYLIAATTAAGVTDLRAWLFDGGVATEVEVSAGPAIPTAAPGRPA